MSLSVRHCTKENSLARIILTKASHEDTTIIFVVLEPKFSICNLNYRRKNFTLPITEHRYSILVSKSTQ